MRAWGLMVSISLVATACGSDSAVEELRALAKKDAPCTTTAECCVVFERCHGTAYVIGEADFSRAKKLVSEVDDSTCNRCVAPPIELACVEGSCVGRELGFDDENEGHRTAHCGTVDSPAEEEAPATSPIQSEEGEHATGRMLGCGA